jgi:hypothetical protein
MDIFIKNKGSGLASGPGGKSGLVQMPKRILKTGHLSP